MIDFLDLLVVIAFWWCMDRMVKARTGRGLFERLLNGIMGQGISNMLQEKL